MGEDGSEIRVKTAFSGDIMVTYIAPTIDLDGLRQEMRDICKFDAIREFTMKWIDEEGDPCIISSQSELDEALRLYDVNKDTEITIHVFPDLPPAPGMPCLGEDKSIYRRGTKSEYNHLLIVFILCYRIHLVCRPFSYQIVH